MAQKNGEAQRECQLEAEVAAARGVVQGRIESEEEEAAALVPPKSPPRARRHLGWLLHPWRSSRTEE